MPNLVWMHSSSAGLEHLLFPELVNGPVTLTNAKGVYSNSLAEFALMACKWFAMDVPRLLRAKREGRWEPFDVEELRGNTMGVVGFGDIGQACARLAKAYQMKVVGLRRNTQLSEAEAQLVVRD
jgi:phosphoglycerate dehydrogenase-like enzyme